MNSLSPDESSETARLVAELATRGLRGNDESRDDDLESRIVETVQRSYDALVALAPALAVHWPRGLAEPRVRSALHLGLESEVWSAPDLYQVLQPLLTGIDHFQDFLRAPERVPLGVRLRTASLVRGIALAARECTLEALVPRSRHAPFVSLVARLCRDRHAPVAFRAAYAVGILERDIPNLASEVGLLDGSPLMMRRRIVAVNAQWVHGDIDDAALDTALEDAPGARDTYARATLLQGMRLGLAHAPRTITARAASMVHDAPAVVLSSIVALALDLDDDTERAALLDAVTVSARARNLESEPALRAWLARGSATTSIFDAVRAQRLAALVSPLSAAAASSRLLRKVIEVTDQLVSDVLGDGDDVEMALDRALFDSTLLRDGMTAGAATLREAAAAREAWATVVRTLRERRALQALKPALHTSQRRERLRLLTHALDALAGDLGPPGAIGEGTLRSLPNALVEQSRRETGTVNHRPLANALAVCVESEIGAGRLASADAFAALTQLPTSMYRHLAGAFSEPAMAGAFGAVDELVRAIAVAQKLGDESPASSRAVSSKRHRAAIALEDSLWRTTRAVTALGATGRHPLARAYGGATAACLHVLQHPHSGEPVVQAWCNAIGALGESVAAARAKLGIASTEGPKGEVLARRVREAFDETALAHQADTRGVALRPLDELLDATLRLRSTLGSTSWRGTKIGDFVVVNELGAGGMGRCLLARLRSDRVKDGAQWVVKLPSDSARGERGKTMRDLFRDEAKALIALASRPHPAVVEFVAYHERGYGLPFVVMRLVPGDSLSRFISYRPMGIAGAVECAMRIADGLAHAHAHGVGHHDVKPDNIILSSTDGQPVLVDWGLAGAAFRGMVGTPNYMAPERYGTVRPPPSEAFSGDVFALGCTIIEMITGKPLISDAIRPADDEIVPGFTKALGMFLAEGARWRFACQSIATNAALVDARVVDALGSAPGALVPIVRSMLHPEPARRPSARRVVEMLGAVNRA